MSRPGEADLELERLLERTMHQLPVRRAPANLESRVLAELARRGALPWWSRCYAHWPQTARLAFLTMSIGLTGLAVAAGGWAASGFRSLHGFGVSTMPWAQQAAVALRVAQRAAMELARVVPPELIYGGAALGAVLYATLALLGAAAYRTLFLKCATAGELEP